MHIKVQSFTAIQSRPFCIPQDPLSGTPARDTGTALDPGPIRLSKLTSGVILERCGTASCRRICCEEPDAILGSLSISATGWMGSKLRRNRKDLTSVAKASYQRWATRTHGCSLPLAVVICQSEVGSLDSRQMGLKPPRCNRIQNLKLLQYQDISSTCRTRRDQHDSSFNFLIPSPTCAPE
jgi:hypothetical protein